MKVKYEYLNFLSGVMLLIAGIVQFYYRHIEMGFGWIIFGSMYLVMDDYTPKDKDHNFMGIVIYIGRKVFSWVGLVGSSLLLAYYLSGMGS